MAEGLKFKNAQSVNWEILSLTRFLLAMIVMTGHLKSFGSIGFLNWYDYLGSFEAILGFLLISGFSIGKSILRNKKAYFKRRLQRIYPVYLASIAFQIIVSESYFHTNSIPIVFINLLFLNHIIINYSIVGPAWTLATEVWLYCLAPFFLKIKDRWLTICIFTSFGAYIFYTCGRTLLHWDYYSSTNYGINVLVLSFTWIAGFKLAISTKKNVNKRIILILFTGHLLLTAAIQVLFRIKNHAFDQILNTDAKFIIGNSVCLILVYLIVVYNSFIPEPSGFFKKTFSLLGNISYPLYLTHITSFDLLTKVGISNPYILLIAGLGISYLIYLAFDFYSQKRVIKHSYPLSKAVLTSS